MIDGIYEGMLNTPMGKIDGNIILKTNGDQVSGYIEAFGQRSQFSKGITTQNGCKVYGQINYMLGSLKYEADVTIQNGNLQAQINTNKGAFEIHAKKKM